MTDPRDTIEPDERGRPEQIADEQLAHGLLEFSARDGAGAQRQRVDRVMRAIGDDRLASPAHRAPWAAAATLAAAVLVVVLVFGLTGGRSASDLVQEAVAMADRAGDRRYDVRVFLHRPSADPVVTGTLDVRDADHFVLRAHVHGMRVILGRSSGSPWSVDPHGGTQRLDAARDGHWLILDHVAVMLDSVDAVLAHLGRGYALDRAADETLEGHGDTPFERVSARREQPLGGTPHHIELWLQRESHELQRMELRWPEPGHAPHRPHGQQHGQQHGQHGPHLHHGAPKFGAGDHVPPRSIVFELVDRPALAHDWFDPDTHTK